MRRKILKQLFKKQVGNVFVEASIAFFIIIATMLSLGYGYSIWMNEYEVNDKVDLIMTAEMKSMESNGCLTLADKGSLINDLTNAGLTEINLTGNIGVEQSYGQPVNLTLTGNLDLANSKNAAIAGMVKSIRKFIGNDEIGKIQFSEKSYSGTAKN